MDYRICYYKTARGDTPFEVFLNGLNDKVKAKFIKMQTILAEHGPDLKRPYADMLRDDIRELRVMFGSNTYRALFFFFGGRNILITHGFMKKTDRVSQDEIERALRYKHDFEARIGRGESES